MLKNKRYLSVTVTGVVVRETSVTSGRSVRDEEPSTSVVLPLTEGGPVVRPKPALCSLVRDETTSVPSWF